jgi:hypothetical protein
MSEMPNLKLQRQDRRCRVSAFGYSPPLIVSVA